MKICNQYNHSNARNKLEQKNGILSEIKLVLTQSKLTFGKNSSKEIKNNVSLKFNQEGWADKVKVGNSNLTISFMKDKVGVCFQIGNVARTYADILKLSLLNKKGIIDVGVIIVPHKIESKLMGANYAHYDRLTNELKQVSDIISAPILVIGLSN
mgnify:FL=1